MKETKGCSTWAFFNKEMWTFCHCPLVINELSLLRGKAQLQLPTYSFLINLSQTHCKYFSSSWYAAFTSIHLLMCFAWGAQRFLTIHISSGVVFQHQPLPHQIHSYEFTMGISFLTHVNNLDAFHVIFLSWKFNLHFLDRPIIPKGLSCLSIT